MASTNDVIEDTINSIGKWQIFMAILLAVARINISWHQLGIVFLAPITHFECSINSIDKCSEHCPSHDFDHSVFGETIVTQWDLVCQNAHLVSIAQSIFLVGILMGSLAFGILSDRYGRKIPLMFAILMELLTGVGAAFAPSYWLFVTLKYLSNFAIGGILVITFVLVMEIIGTSYRTTIGILIHVPFYFGYGLLGLLGYLIRDWHYLQLAISLPAGIFLIYYFIIPESPRWLLMKGRTEEAIALLKKAAKFNQLPTYSVADKVNLHLTNVTPKNSGTFKDLFRTNEMRMRTICVDAISFCIFLVYFGASQYIGQIGDIFINVGISGFVQVPGTIISIIAMNKLGRKLTLILSNFLCSIFCLLIIVGLMDSVPDWALTIIGALCILFNGISISVHYVYTGELYPTVIRSAAMGISATFGKFGSALAPFIVDLKNFGGWLPPVVLAVCSFLPCLFALKLPETRNLKLPDTIDEALQISNDTERKSSADK